MDGGQHQDQTGMNSNPMRGSIPSAISTGKVSTSGLTRGQSASRISHPTSGEVDMVKLSSKI